MKYAIKLEIPQRLEYTSFFNPSPYKENKTTIGRTEMIFYQNHKGNVRFVSDIEHCDKFNTKEEAEEELEKIKNDFIFKAEYMTEEYTPRLYLQYCGIIELD